MGESEKYVAEARNGLEKLTNKVLPGIFNTNSKMTQDKIEKLPSECEEDSVEMRQNTETKVGSHRQARVIVCAVFLLCCAGALQGILVNGLINVVISTIEKR